MKIKVIANKIKVVNTTTAKLNYKVKACIWIYKRFSQNFFQNLLKVREKVFVNYAFLTKKGQRIWQFYKKNVPLRANKPTNHSTKRHHIKDITLYFAFY